MDVLTLALGVLLGLTAGAALGAARAVRLARRRRAEARAGAGIARFGLDALPVLTAAELLSNRVTVTLGGEEYSMPVLPRAASAAWLARLDARFAHLADALDEAADDRPRILMLLAGEADKLLELLRDYDVTGVLPDQATIDRDATNVEIIVAMLGVWRLANPLAAILAAGADGETDGTSIARPSISPLSTDGLPSMSTIT